jgi:ATP-dependent DNA helicase RecG
MRDHPYIYPRFINKLLQSMQLLLKHIRESKSKGAPFKDLEQVLPSHSQNQIKVLVRDLQRSNLIYPIGKTSAARWVAR